MISLEILDVKSCMSHLLLKDTFHAFYFIEGDIATFNTFHIDGQLHKDFFDTAEAAERLQNRKFSYWKEIQEFCYSLIKGKRTPLGMKLIFSLSDANTEKFLTQNGLAFDSHTVNGLYLNFKYDGTALKCITGVSLSTFTLDKSLENAWDEMVRRFFHQKEITVKDAVGYE